MIPWRSSSKILLTKLLLCNTSKPPGCLRLMWLLIMKTLPLASEESSGAIEAYHLKLKLKLYDDSNLGALQRVDWLVYKLTTELLSSYWLDRYADESDSFKNVKEEYISSTSWHRALEIPDEVVVLEEENHHFAKVLSQKDATQSHIVWNPGSEFSFCDCAWAMQGNLCKHVIKSNMVFEKFSLSFRSFREILINLWQKPMDDSFALDQSIAWTHNILDQIQRLVELDNCKDISKIVDSLPLKWVAKKGRTFIGRPSSTLALPPNVKSSCKKVVVRKSRKRKRVARLR
ncbi:hypothetical protein GIB67_029779 [Kingdonia uniflora]|uniref:SWIM-type domain-containing protein n=1 Tax=Kingdonia uniflora TaxID=39325 RepID=A0A7J7NIR2_9MAGN|nr:hypothetical protein GIB67_029779 [Kingdonia uniflora]